MARRESLRSRGKPEVRSAPLWMITWADMMTLLLAFFILIAAFSNTNEKKLRQAVESIQGALGAAEAEKNPAPGEAVPADIQKLARELQRKMQVSGNEEDVRITFDKEGSLKIVMPERITFDTASADLKAESYGVLQTVGEMLSQLAGVFIEVRGHTDNRPLQAHARFRDNYDLSYARADSVARRLNAVSKVPMDQFEIIACGPGQPVATNETEPGRLANRRVEIFVRGLPDSSKITPLESRGAQTESDSGGAPRDRTPR